MDDESAVRAAPAPRAETAEQLEQRIRGLGQTVLGLSWQPQHRADSLEQLFRAADAIGASAGSWYLSKCRWKRRLSLLLRAEAIALSGGGILIPLVGTAVKASAGFTSWGYVCFAAAGICVGADRFFGLSSSWIRFITSHMTIERALTTFRFQWALFQAGAASAGAEPGRDETLDALQRILRFVELVNTEVLRETEVWAKEFQSAMADLERMVRTERERAEPGAVRVTIDGAGDVTDVRILVDGVPGPMPAGKRCTLPRVPPGQHSIEVHGRRDGQPVGDAAIFDVTSSGVEDVTLDLSP